MLSLNSKRGLLGSSALITALTAGLAALPAQAQTAAGAAEEVSEVVVTGTRIPQPNLESVSAVSVIGSEEVKQTGLTRTEDLINRMPQAFAAQGSSISNGSTGIASIDLRGLGPDRTLVLIDGRRLMPGAPGAGAANSAADLNFVPAALISRVDVMTGGASAVYGADAVAGVVNFIMQRNFEGFRADAQYAFYHHENDNGRVHDILARRAATAFDPDRFAKPDKNVIDGETTEVNFVWGTNFEEGRGNITAYAGYRGIRKVLQGDRDYSSCSLQASNAAQGLFNCGGSGTTSPAQFQVGAGAAGIILTLDPTAAGGRGFRPYVASRDAYNFGPTNFYMRPDERYTMGAFVTFDLAPHVQIYADMMFMDDRSDSQAAPSGLFLDPFQFNCDSPLISAGQRLALCGPTIDQVPATAGLQTDADPLLPGQQGVAAIGRRNVEGGGRVEELRHTSYRYVVGMRGDLGENFRYDAYGQYGTVAFTSRFLNDLSRARIVRSLDVVANPAGGGAVCRSVLTGADPSCVPYDIFSITGPSREATAYLSTPGLQIGKTREWIVSANINGDLTPYGIKSPLAESGVGVAIGAEYRREQLDFQPDIAYQTDDLTGQGGAVLPVLGAFDVYEVFGELRVPLIEDQPFFKELTLETGYRYSDYSVGFSTDTYKLGGDWKPVEDVRFRAGLNRSVRAPNIFELFAPQTVALNGGTDPCAGATPQFSREQCARQGVTPDLYGRIVADSASQYQGLIGGNPNLEPETSDTISFGVVLTPTMLPRFTLSLDWYDIKVEDRIGQIGQDVTLSRCGLTGDPYYCTLIHRAPGTGSLFIGREGFVTDTNLNTGSLRVKGIDIEANYRFDLGELNEGLADAGSLTANFVGSYLDSYKIQTLPGDPAFDCSGLFGQICTGSAVPTGGILAKWKHKARLTWKSPWDVELGLTWRHISAVEVDSSDAEIVDQAGGGGGVFLADSKLKAQDYFDLSARWEIWDAKFRLGVNNVFDREPPLVSQQNCAAVFCNGNSFPMSYDALGRYLFIGVTKEF